MISILLLASNPQSTPSLALSEEAREIDDALHNARYGSEIKLELKWAARLTDLTRYLEEIEPDIVHFSGHGEKTSEIVFEDSRGNSQPVTKEQLRQIFSNLKGRTRCVVLNTCFSEPQANAIAREIACVIGMSKEIGDTESIAFAREFYRQIANGHDVQRAFDLGHAQLNAGYDVVRLDAPSVNASDVRFVGPDTDNENIRSRVGLLHLMLDQIQEAHSSDTLKVITMLLEKDRQNIQFDAKSILVVLKQKTIQWISDAMSNENDDQVGLIVLVRRSLLTIANISVIVDQVSEGKEYFRERRMQIDTYSGSESARKPLTKALEYFSQEVLEKNKSDLNLY